MKSSKEKKVNNTISHYRNHRFYPLKQEQLANMVDIKTSSLSNYENGRQTPNVLVALRLAKALGCTVNDLYPIEYKEEDGAKYIPIPYDEMDDLTQRIQSFFKRTTNDNRLKMYCDIVTLFIKECILLPEDEQAAIHKEAQTVISKEVQALISKEVQNTIQFEGRKAFQKELKDAVHNGIHAAIKSGIHEGVQQAIKDKVKDTVYQTCKDVGFGRLLVGNTNVADSNSFGSLDDEDAGFIPFEDDMQ